MIIVMEANAREKDIEEVKRVIINAGLDIHISTGTDRTILGVVGDKKKLGGKPLEMMPGVEKIVPIMNSYKLASRTFKNGNTIVKVGNVEVGGDEIVIMAGPCAVESREQLFEVAEVVKISGAQFLRGGVYKPRTSPYSFKGLKEQGLLLLDEVKRATGLKIVTEVMSTENLEAVAQYSDVLQIGARNMQNFNLLEEVGKIKKPVLLKRGLSSTIEEWLNAAEYIMCEGNYDVILCERGIRTFETATRNTLDLSAIPVIKENSHLPIIIDPSHGTGVWKYVCAMSKAAVAAGADGLMIEVHPNPLEALSDGAQSLRPDKYNALAREIKVLAEVCGRKFNGD
ncbi:phospho-2-dehydro-3-deoxyheptonate aldolase [Oxobacter pfennigii]|uniref:Phospho-2-dehydro-3-deoxyheptonate aldolase n=1 Tax=Oxobacter pfennigii TaxID=36849 RepID=A0A0P8WZY9_9CLOT|nr:3-deoxy-7-phosphoheptulonate synthase [Oxobacter pfennigii]KPU44073.1 phospho-2-dehydro-3-deoxyheptonate aldolase [Oxobacter pfennigii]